jgi:hypothetical protein
MFIYYRQKKMLVPLRRIQDCIFGRLKAVPLPGPLSHLQTLGCREEMRKVSHMWSSKDGIVPLARSILRS